MICTFCQRALRTGEGLKCGACESRYHFKCVGETNKDHRDSGDDGGYQWQCALCKKTVSKTQANPRNTREYHELVQTLHSVRERIDVIHRIQLPKFYNDITHVKTVTEFVNKQNEDILRKIDEIDCRIKRLETDLISQYNDYRLRNKNSPMKSNNAVDINERSPLSSGTKKTIWYRKRRKSYLLHNVLRLLNNRKETSRKYRRQ